VHGTKAPALSASRLHSKLPASLELNVKLAVVWFVLPDGPELIVVAEP
jgi:hypothetical protein